MSSSLIFGSAVVLIVLCCDQVVGGSYKSEIYYNLVNTGSVSEAVNVTCRNELKKIANGIDDREIWSLKILDASGRFGSGFVWGNNYMLGVRHACQLLQDPIILTTSPMFEHLHHPNLTQISSPFPVEYRVIYIRHKSKMQYDLQIYDRKYLTLGICFPQSCSNEDAFRIAEEVLDTLDFPGRELVGETTVLSSKTLKLRDNFWTDSFVKIFTYLSLFFLANVIIGTVYIYHLRKTCVDSKKNDDYDISSVKKTFLEKWFDCFSLFENFKAITALTTVTENLDSIHGIRALSMPWLIMGHILLYAQGAIDNLESDLTYTELWYFQPFTTDFLGVDTFVALSGFLVGYLFVAYQKKNENIGYGVVIKAIVARYIRLVPFLAIIVLMSYVMVIYLEDTSPFKLGEDIENNCAQFYWRNLLLINNLFPGLKICCTWTWFAANDFQCYTIGIVLLFLYSRNKKIGLSIGCGIAIICILLNMIGAFRIQYSLSVDALYHFQDYTYYPLFTRLPCYLVGLVAGNYLSKINRQLHIPRLTAAIYWLLSIGWFMGNIYFHIYKIYHPIYIPIYTGFARIGWALAVSWAIIACSTGYGGFVTTILGSKYLLPLSRLSYPIYLTNVMVIPLIYFSAEHSYHVVFITYIFEFLGIFIGCLLFALLAKLVYEAPLSMFFRTFLIR